MLGVFDCLIKCQLLVSGYFRRHDLRCFQTLDVYISILYFAMLILHMDSVDSVFVVYNCEARIVPEFRSYLAMFL